MKIYSSIEELIGNTPLLKLENYKNKYTLKADILAKLEYFNPAGSVKDRVARKMIEDAEMAGKIKPGAVIIEPTSGNTGIGLAAIAAAKGYRTILTMPDTMSVERRKLLAAYGAEIVLTEGARGMAGAIEKASELADKIEGAFIPGQFDNLSNPAAHYETTGPEIWNDTDGQIDIFVACVGTGGTLTGTARFLKEQNPDIKVIAVEPATSALLSGGEAGAHKIQGIGANFIPSILDRGIYDEVITVEDEDALSCGAEIAKCEGILVGISSGAALSAAKKVALRPENACKRIVVLFPDTGERYLSSEMFK